MAQSIITLAFETYKAQQEALATSVELNEFVLALVPNQNPNAPIDRNETVPPSHQIVHVAEVTQTGFVNPNAVVYSLIMDTRVGDFEFNWVGLRNKQSGVLAAILHIPTVSKFKSIPGVQNGNSVTRSILMSYEGAQQATGITVDASTWQIDFTARLFGIDEVERLANADLYGPAAFLSDGFKVTRSGADYVVKSGCGYVGGLRCPLEQDVTLSHVTPSTGIYLDASWQGHLTSQWQTVCELKASATPLTNYVDSDGYPHYVTKVADIDGAGNVVDRRHVEGFSEYERIENAATNTEIDGKSDQKKHVKLPQLWRALSNLLSNRYTGNRTDLAVTEKALSDGLATKSGSAHHHDNDYYLKSLVDGFLADKLDKSATAVNADKLDNLDAGAFVRGDGGLTRHQYFSTLINADYRRIASARHLDLSCEIRVSISGTTTGLVANSVWEISSNHNSTAELYVEHRHGGYSALSLRIYFNPAGNIDVFMKTESKAFNANVNITSLNGCDIYLYTDNPATTYSDYQDFDAKAGSKMSNRAFYAPQLFEHGLSLSEKYLGIGAKAVTAGYADSTGWATHAESATQANRAGRSDVATNSDRLGGKGPSSYYLSDAVSAVYSGRDVPWNVNSGVYSENSMGNYSLVAHFKGSHSTSAAQIRFDYRNGGMWYRSSRDAYGFEEDFIEVYTSKSPPPVDVLASMCPVGVPLPWPSKALPLGFFECRGQSFNKAAYPLLAKAYPSGSIPDLRGEFIRGWDNGRGVDNEVLRGVLTTQGDAIRNITGAFGAKAAGNFTPTGAFGTPQPISGGSNDVGAEGPERLNFDASRVVPVAPENRPRNIAFMYIVRAA